ncbi:hypothetical protein P3342_004810 [Pyrenophora teres f. teres]|nr:hypothetical protein P3342_004810 [Pyrenophora teres f. teres]
MDRTRHLADSESKYRLYFELLHRKITEYHLEARDIYNMDEKGFLIGLIGRSKRIFSRRQWEKKKVRASLQDGSREFLTDPPYHPSSHSTHTLQPVLFKPLSQAYSNELTNHLHKAQGLTLIKKGDFFPLFWSAWISSFTESLILKAFEATGIWPMDANVILRRFASTPDAERSSSSGLSDHDWRKLDRLVRAAFNDSHQYEARKLRSSVHHISVQYELYSLRTRA